LEKKYDIVIEANKGTVSKRGWRLGGKRLLTATAILGTKAVEVEDGLPKWRARTGAPIRQEGP
jgi:hypothetical protein